MIDLEQIDGTPRVELYIALLRSLREFDRVEIEGVTRNLIQMTSREECLLTLYLRAQRNVDTLLVLNDIAHYQAILMLSRTIFELSIDQELLEKNPGSELKMLAYKSIEILRAARASVVHEDEHRGKAPIKKNPRREYITNRGPGIEAVVKSLWPNTKMRDLKHWTGRDLSRRVQEIGGEAQKLYALSYRQFSWFVHSGLQGTFGAPPEQFPRLCSLGYNLAAMSYKRLLESTARMLHIVRHDQQFKDKLEYALALPLTESPEDESQIRRELGLA